MTNSVDTSYCILGAKYIRKQAKQLLAQLEEVRNPDDAEYVHQSRVASRRLRAALRMFRDCYAKRQRKAWQKEIRRVTEGLGEARDCDVQIEFLCKTLAEMTDPSCYSGIARMLVEIEKNRERLQAKVVRAANRLESSGVLNEMREATRHFDLDSDSDSDSDEPCGGSPLCFEQCEQHILDCLNEMQSFQHSLDDAEDHPNHHAMRIAAKRLRYTLEIAGPVYEGRVDADIKAVKRLQTLLGDIHDCDVWVERLDAFAERERVKVNRRTKGSLPFARLETGIDFLRQQRQEQRRETFGQLVDYWRQLEAESQWERLIATVRARGEYPSDAAEEKTSAEPQVALDTDPEAVPQAG